MNKRKIFLGLALILLSSMSVSSHAAGGPFFKTEPCPAGQSGTISYRNDSTSTPSAGGWRETSRNCVNNGPTVVGTMTETQYLACPSNQPSGTWMQTRTYQLWSDGSHRNVSGWSDSTKSCTAIKQSIGTETQNMTCPAAQPSGIWTQKRTYEQWSDGSKKNYSSWSDFTKTCTAVFRNYGYNNSKSVCPTNTPLGVINTQQKYETWSDGSVRNSSAWYETSRTCAAIPRQTVETTEGVEEVNCDSYYGAAEGSYAGSVYKYGEYISIFDANQTTKIFNVKSIDTTSCTAEIEGLSTEYMSGDCPAGENGLIQYYRYKAVNGKSEVVYPYGSAWVTSNNTCSAMDVDKIEDGKVQDGKISLLSNIYFTSTDIIKNDALTGYLKTLADKGWSTTDKHKLTINIDDLSSEKYNVTKVSNAIEKFQSVVGVNNADVDLVLPHSMDKLMGDGGVTAARTSSKSITLKSIELVGKDAVVKYLDISSGNSNSMPVEKQFKIPVLTSAVSLQGVSAN